MRRGLRNSWDRHIFCKVADTLGDFHLHLALRKACCNMGNAPPSIDFVPLLVMSLFTFPGRGLTGEIS